MFSRRQAAARPVPDLNVSGFSFALLLFGREKKHTLLYLCLKWSISTSAVTCLHTRAVTYVGCRCPLPGIEYVRMFNYDYCVVERTALFISLISVKMIISKLLNIIDNCAGATFMSSLENQMS